MFEMNRRFGLELEFCSSRVNEDQLRSALVTALSAHGKSIGRGGYTSWVFKYDGSCGFEITTPILRSEEWDEARQIIWLIQHQFPGQSLVSRRCGLHVHIDYSDRNERDLLKLTKSFVRLHELIHTMVPHSRNGNGYCHSFDESNIPFSHSAGFNASSWEIRGDIEIRYGGATCNKDKIDLWVRFVHGVINRTEEVGPPSSPIGTMEQFLEWCGDLTEEEVEFINRWEERIEYLRTHNPGIHRDNYRRARSLRNNLPTLHRQYHYHIRREMSREERRAHDQEVLRKSEEGTLEDWPIPDEFRETFYEEHPDERPEMVEEPTDVAEDEPQGIPE